MQTSNLFLFAILLIASPIARATEQGEEVNVPVEVTEAVVVPTEAAAAETTIAEAEIPVTEAAAPEPTEAAAPEPTEAAAPEPTEATVPEQTEATVPEQTEATVPEQTDAPVVPTEETPVDEESAPEVPEESVAPEVTSRPLFSSTDSSSDEPLELTTSLEDLFNSTTNSTSASYRSVGSFFVAPIVLFALAQ